MTRDEEPTRVAVLYNSRQPAQRSGPEGSIGMPDALPQVESVAAALDELSIPYSVTRVESGEQVTRVLDGVRDAVVLNLVVDLDNRAGNSAIVPYLCDLAGVPCTGGGYRNLVITGEKYLVNSLLAARGVPVPKAWLFQREDFPSLPGDVGHYPLIVKPVREGGSSGIGDDSVVRDWPGVVKAVERVWETYDQPAIVEQMIGQREVSVSMLQEDDFLRVLPMCSYEFPHTSELRPPILSYDSKWVPGSPAWENAELTCPARLTDALASELDRIARLCWTLLECRDYLRIDIRLDENLAPFVIEVNSNPDVVDTPDNDFPVSLRAAGIPYRHFVRQLLLNAAARTGPTT